MAVASPSSRTQTSSRSYTSAFASASAATFSSRTYSSSVSAVADANIRLHRQSSSTSSSVKFSVEQRPGSPVRRSITVTSKKQRNSHAVSSTSSQKKTCLCSPTTHPGSFRCSYHKQLAEQQQRQRASSNLNLLRSAMKNSLVRIGGVEGELAKRTLTTLIRPSSHQLRRREAFQPRPSRLSRMSKAQDPDQ